MMADTPNHDDYIDKVYKADYVNLQTTFMTDLTSLAGTLKSITDKNEKNQSDFRKSLLQDTLKHLN
jgi:hypothetical protein